jgi:hypothetical protein
VKVSLQFEESNIRISDVLDLVLVLCQKQYFPALKSLEVQAPNVLISDKDVDQVFRLPQDCGVRDLQLNLSDNKFSEIQLYNIILSFLGWHRGVLEAEPNLKLKTNLNLNRCESLTTKIFTNLLNAQLANPQKGNSVLVNAKAGPIDPLALQNLSQKTGVRIL